MLEFTSNLKPQILAIASLLMGLTALNAEASLTSYAVNGVNFVRMQGGGFDVSFTKDGNLFQTLASTNANLVSQIAAITPTYNDSYFGLQTIDAGDFNTSTGQMNWWGAKAFINYLNHNNYGGSNQWSLPNVTDTGTAGCNFSISGTDCGYNVNPSTSTLAQLYFNELSKKSYYDTNGNFQNGFGIFGDNGAQLAGGVVGPFSNVQSSMYWSGSEYVSYPAGPWYFLTNFGYQYYDFSKFYQFYAWAVTPGQVASVPVPGSIWLMGSSMLGLLGMKRRHQAA